MRPFLLFLGKLCESHQQIHRYPCLPLHPPRQNNLKVWWLSSKEDISHPYFQALHQQQNRSLGIMMTYMTYQKKSMNSFMLLYLDLNLWNHIWLYSLIIFIKLLWINKNNDTRRLKLKVRIECSDNRLCITKLQFYTEILYNNLPLLKV